MRGLTAENRSDILALDISGLKSWLEKYSEPSYRARQIFSWIYTRGVDNFSLMTDLGRNLRKILEADFYIGSLNVRKRYQDSDLACKYLFEAEDGRSFEAVLMRHDDRVTVCLSSQVGCAYGCKFCLTGGMGYVRNLRFSEILHQLLIIKNETDNITNIVFMGMGEPLANYDNVRTAIEIITSPEGIAFSPRRITVSTVGLVPGIGKLAEELIKGLKLAVSLNAPDDELRSELMPVNRRYNIEALMEACRKYPISKRERITFEYVLMKGVNDSDDQARKLAALVRDIRCKVNIIPFNNAEGLPYERPDFERIERFHEILAEKNICATVRYSKGLDIKAACGLLAVENQLKSREGKDEYSEEQTSCIGTVNNI